MSPKPVIRELTIKGKIYSAVEQYPAGSSSPRLYRAFCNENPNKYVAIRLRYRRDVSERKLTAIKELGEKFGTSHGALPKIIAYAQDERYEYLVTKWVDGYPLSRYTNTSQPGKPYFVPDWSRQMAISLIEGLRDLHSNHLYHGDIKPDNLVVVVQARNKPPKLRLIDFGSAWMGQRTKEQIQVATPGYAAPEQLNPDVGLTDHRADQFSFSVVLFEMLTGVLPYEGLGGQVTRSVKFTSPSAINPDVWASLDRVLEKGLKYRPGERFETTPTWLNALMSCTPPDSWKPPTVNEKAEVDSWLVRLLSNTLNRLKKGK